MRTRSQSKRNRQLKNVTELRPIVEDPVPRMDGNPNDPPIIDDAAPDLRTMEELCQPTNARKRRPHCPS